MSGAKIMELAQGLGLSIDDLHCDETDERDMVNVEESPGVYVYRKRQWGECFCHAYDDSECACGGLWEQRETARQRGEVCQRLSTLAANLAVAAFGQAMFRCGTRHGRDGAALDEGYIDEETYAKSWRPGCGHPAPGFEGRE